MSDCTTTCQELGRLRSEVDSLKATARTACQRRAASASQGLGKRAKVAQWARKQEALSRGLVEFLLRLPQLEGGLEGELAELVDRARRDLGKHGKVDRSIPRRVQVVR